MLRRVVSAAARTWVPGVGGRVTAAAPSPVTRSFYSHTLAPPSPSLSSPTMHAARGGPDWHATTILAVRKGNQLVMIGDGQVSMGSVVVKPNARKVRRIGQGHHVVAGFAGATADAFTLVERLESKLEEYPGQLLRAGVETAKLWRTDRHLRHLEAMLIACDENISLCISGNGDVIEPHDGILAIGSGGSYALAAARALIEVPDYDAMKIATKAMEIAADMCVYTNNRFVIETITKSDSTPSSPPAGSPELSVPTSSSSSSAASSSSSASTVSNTSS